MVVVTIYRDESVFGPYRAMVTSPDGPGLIEIHNIIAWSVQPGTACNQVEMTTATGKVYVAAGLVKAPA